MDKSSNPTATDQVKPYDLSVCLFCGSSNTTSPDYLEGADRFGRILAQNGVRLVYGGGGVGLMGRAAKAAHAEGGAVHGIIPEFLRTREVIYDDVETVVVPNMHERKRQMYEASDAFAIFPGGIGTLEEVVELMSWRRLELHYKPIVFVDLNGFWQPFFRLIEHTVNEKLTPAWLPSTWSSVTTVEEVLPTVRRMLAEGPASTGNFVRERS
jgi:uncharacterized protein (TIGR00730 family)